MKRVLASLAVAVFSQAALAQMGPAPDGPEWTSVECRPNPANGGPKWISAEVRFNASGDVWIGQKATGFAYQGRLPDEERPTDGTEMVVKEFVLVCRRAKH